MVRYLVIELSEGYPTAQSTDFSKLMRQYLYQDDRGFIQVAWKIGFARKASFETFEIFIENIQV